MANECKPGSRAQVSQKTLRVDIDAAGGMREQNDTFLDGTMQIEPATDFPSVIEGGSQIDTHSIWGSNWPGALDGRSRTETYNADWPQSSINIIGAAVSESAPSLPHIGSTTSDQTNISTGDFHSELYTNELYTLFDHNYTSNALSNTLLWSLFPPENQP